MSESRGAAEPRSGAAAARVVLADQDEIVRLLLASLLESDPRFEVVGRCADGAGAIELCATADLVVLDILLADTDGFTVMDRLRVAYPDLRIVMYSALDAPYLRAEATAHGADAYVSKTAPPAGAIEAFATAMSVAQ